MQISRAGLLVAFLCVGTSALATVISPHYLNSIQIGPRGELLVTGSMGSMLSTDGGVRWTLPMTLEELFTTSKLSWARKGRTAVPVRDRRGRLYTCSKDGVSVVTSDNNGKDWTTQEILDKRSRGTHVKEGSSSSIVRGAYTDRYGVRWMTDLNGEFRQPRNDAEEGIAVSGIYDSCAEVVMSGDMPHVFARYGIYWSENRGQSWRGNYHFLGRYAIKSPPLGFRLFADSKAALYTTQDGENGFRMHRSNDRGATWEKLLFGLDENDTGDMVILRVHKDVLYFVAQDRKSARSTFYKSRGTTAVRLLEVEQVVGGYEFFDIGPKDQLAVAGAQEVYTSTNDGQTWTTISKGSLMKGSWIINENRRWILR